MIMNILINKISINSSVEGRLWSVGGVLGDLFFVSNGVVFLFLLYV